MEMQDFYYRYISNVFDNYEEHYWEVQELVKEYKKGKILSLGYALADLYHDAISKVLDAPHDSALGHRLIEELCYGVPQHIFDEIADKYLPSEETVDA